jgi:hypothetical protein
MSDPYDPFAPNDPNDSNAADMDLRALDGDFADAPVEEKKFQEIPDGKYQVSVDGVEITKTKASGKSMLKWTLKIRGPRFAGRLLWKNNVMIPGPNMGWLKQDLRTCGLELELLSQLRAHLPSLLGVWIEVTKKTVGENSNIYFNKRIATDESSGSGHGGENYDGVPF